jgi:hypothetical protein
VPFAKAARRVRKPRPVQFLGKRIEWVETANCLAVTLVHRWLGRHGSTRWERRQLEDWACLAPSLTGEAVCPSEGMCCSTSSSSVLWWITHVRSGGSLPAAMSKAASLTIQVSSHCDERTLVRWEEANSRGFGDSTIDRPHQSTHWPRVSTQS